MRFQELPLVTIAIPIYNSERHLEDSVWSVINQTYDNWELILIDDGSTDNSLSIALKFQSLNSKIRVISDGRNLGLPTRLNETIKLANGKYYARMDSDDIMCTERIQTQVEFLECHPEIDVLGSSIMTIDNKNNIIGSGAMEDIHDSFVHPSVIAKLSWFKDNLYNEKFRRSQDAELWIRTINKSTFYNLPNVLLFYREFGIPTLSKYIRSQKCLRRIYCSYKQYGFTRSWAIKHLSITYVKQFLFCLFYLFGKSEFLIGQRRRQTVASSKLLTESDIQKAIKRC